MLSYCKTTDKWHVSERRKTVWSSCQAIHGEGHATGGGNGARPAQMDAVAPGGARGVSSSRSECRSCTHRDFLDRGNVDLVSKSDGETASSSPFQKAGGFFHSHCSDRRLRIPAFRFYVQSLAPQSRAYWFRSIQDSKQRGRASIYKSSLTHT